ncbi:hypothetical protein D3C74_379040 [compost metagenome]
MAECAEIRRRQKRRAAGGVLPAPRGRKPAAGHCCPPPGDPGHPGGSGAHRAVQRLHAGHCPSGAAAAGARKPCCCRGPRISRHPQSGRDFRGRAAAGQGRQKRAGPAGLGGPAAVCYAKPPVSHWRGAAAGPAAPSVGMGTPAGSADRGGRLRQRVPLGRPAHRAAEGT